MAPWPRAAIRRVDQRALDEYQAANNSGCPLPPEGLMNAPLPLRSRHCFDGKIYGLMLMIALGEDVYNLLGYFDEIESCIVEKRMPLHHAVKEYGRILAEVLAEDAEDLGWVRPPPRSIANMKELHEVMSEMDLEAKAWKDKWPIVPVLLLLPVDFSDVPYGTTEPEETGPEDTEPKETDDDMKMDALCTALVGDDACGARAFRIVWDIDLYHGLDKDEFVSLSEFQAFDGRPIGQMKWRL